MSHPMYPAARLGIDEAGDPVMLDRAHPVRIVADRFGTPGGVNFVDALLTAAREVGVESTLTSLFDFSPYAPHPDHASPDARAVVEAVLEEANRRRKTLAANAADAFAPLLFIFSDYLLGWGSPELDAMRQLVEEQSGSLGGVGIFVVFVTGDDTTAALAAGSGIFLRDADQILRPAYVDRRGRLIEGSPRVVHQHGDGAGQTPAA